MWCHSLLSDAVVFLPHHTFLGNTYFPFIWLIVDTQQMVSGWENKWMLCFLMGNIWVGRKLAELPTQPCAAFGSGTGSMNQSLSSEPKGTHVLLLLYVGIKSGTFYTTKSLSLGNISSSSFPWDNQYWRDLYHCQELVSYIFYLFDFSLIHILLFLTESRLLLPLGCYISSSGF